MEHSECPLVSVIIPAFNAEQYLVSALSSVDLQTYPNLEAVVVNDGSSDATKYIAETYAPAHMTVSVFSQMNAGVSAARNAGIEKARGEYVMFLDADDELPPDAVLHLMDCILRRGADIAVGKLKETTDIEGERRPDAPYSVMLWEGTEALEASLRDDPAGYSACGKVFSKEAIGKKRFPVGKTFHEDSFFCFTCFLNQPAVAVIDEIVYYYRINPESASNRAFSDEHLTILEIADRKMQLVREMYPQLEKLASNMMLKSRLCFLVNLSRCRTNKYANYQRECILEVRSRRKDFIPVNLANRIQFFIIVSGLYPLFKFVRSRLDI